LEVVRVNTEAGVWWNVCAPSAGYVSIYDVWEWRRRRRWRWGKPCAFTVLVSWSITR
jgi:hypothetical protein